MKFSTFTVMLTHCYIALAMQQVPVQGTTKLVVVPGQNVLGGIIKGQIVSNTDIVIPQLKDQRHFCETPALIPDFGQERCLSYLRKTLTHNVEGADNVIIHASSQGTATALNYICNQAEPRVKNIKAVILEAVMLSGNSAIYHTTQRMVAPWATSLPGSYYWLPYIAQRLYINYTPAGIQSILNIDKLPKNIPIIIIHNTHDPQLSYQDAQALYAYLQQNNHNTYLFKHIYPEGDPGHVLLLNEENNKKEIQAIQTILNQHDLLETQTKSEQKVDLTPYQPKVKKKWLDHFNNVLNKEQKIWYFDKILKGTMISVVVYFMHKSGILEKIAYKISS